MRILYFIGSAIAGLLACAVVAALCYAIGLAAVIKTPAECVEQHAMSGRCGAGGGRDLTAYGEHDMHCRGLR